MFAHVFETPEGHDHSHDSMRFHHALAPSIFAGS